MRGERSFANTSLAALLTLSLCVTAAHSVAASAADTAAPELKPDDFAYGMNVVRPGDSAAYRASLPLAVYEKVVRGDLGDVRVFNERDELVPYRIERPTAQSIVQVAPASLPLFPLRSDSREALDAIRITIESGGTRVDVQAPADARARRERQRGTRTPADPATAESDAKGSPALPVASYILDGRSLQSPISAFQLSWPDNAADFAGRLRIEASEDLGTWQTVVTGAPVANLRANDARIVERRVELAGLRSKFWRLSWAGAPAPFELTSVTAEPARDRVDVTRPTLGAEATPVPGKPGEFEFDLAARVPVDRVNLELPEQNSIVEVELLSRALPTQPWRFVARGGFYRLKSTQPKSTTDVEPRPDLTNGALAIEPDSDRYWRARADIRGGGLGQGAPKLRVGWLPHDVVFLARGDGPFTLAYGSAKADATAALGAVPESAAITNATFADPRPLGGDARLSAPAEPRPLWSKSGVLWTVLAIGVAFLAFMAYRLSRELK